MKVICASLFCVVILTGCELVLAPVVIPANALIDRASIVQPVLVKDQAGTILAVPEKPDAPPEAEFIVAKGMIKCSGTIDNVPGYAGALEDAEFRCTSGQRGKVGIGGGVDSWGTGIVSTISVSATREHRCSSSFNRDGPKAGPFLIRCYYFKRIARDDGRFRWVPESALSDEGDRQDSGRETGAAHVYTTQSGMSAFEIWMPRPTR